MIAATRDKESSCSCNSAAQLAATHAAIRALRDRFEAEAREHRDAAKGFDDKFDQSGNGHAERKAARICREHVEALARLLGDGPSKIADSDRKGTETADQRRIEHLTNALSDCLDVIEPIRDELRKQGKEDAATCCDEVIAYSRDALSARLLGDPAQEHP